MSFIGGSATTDLDLGVAGTMFLVLVVCIDFTCFCFVFAERFGALLFTSPNKDCCMATLRDMRLRLGSMPSCACSRSSALNPKRSYNVGCGVCGVVI